MKSFVVTFASLVVFLPLPAAIHFLPALAQPTTSTEKLPYRSSGLRVTIVSTTMDRSGNITTQLAIHNETENRQYLFLAGDREAALTSGEFFSLSSVVGIPACPFNSFLDQCLRDKLDDINSYSYIEPGEFQTMSLRFVRPPAFKPRSESRLSFVVKFMARSASANLGSKVEPMRVVTINMPLVEISGNP